MNEAERKQRNAIKLQELHPSIRGRMEAVLREMESFGYRPRIQEAWRSVKDQLAAYNAGKSKVKYGFHNTTARDGTKEALAADVWDDNRPFNTKTDFMLHLLAAAEKNELTTGIRWSLSENRIKLIEDAIEKQDWKRPVWVGWDPLHVEVTGITVQEAEAGKRPEIPGDQPTDPDEEAEEEAQGKYKPEPIKYRVENLESGRSKDYQLTSPLLPVSLLSVPYISQLGPGAESHPNDCGAAAAAMLLTAYTETIITPGAFYDKVNTSRSPYLNANQVREALGSEGVAAEIKNNLAFKDLFGFLMSGIPCIVITNYKVLFDAGLTEKTFAGPHFSVAVGMDPKYIYVHDPLFTDPEKGNAHAYPLDIFLKAWTATPTISGYAIAQRSAVVPTSAPGVRKVKRIRVTADRLNVRKGPGSNYDVLGVATISQEYTLLSESNGWGQIGPGRWVNLTFTVVIPSTTPLPTPPGSGDDKPEEDDQAESESPQSEPGQGTVINVSLASSVPQNPAGARPAQYLFTDPLIPSAHRDLCGDIALSMVYETITRQDNTLGYIYKGSKNTTRKPTSGSIAYELAQQFANTFPAGWKAHCYYLSYLYHFEAGSQRHLPDSPGGLKKSLTQISTAELKAMITKMILSSTFVIAGVTQNTKMDGLGAARLKPKGVGHWVVVTGVSDEHVYINNPFMNRRETYPWEEFKASFCFWALQIFPPAGYRPQVYSGPMDKVQASLEQDRNKV